MTDRPADARLEHLEHLDTDTIADLIENLLPAPEAHRAREHVKACPDCQQTYDALVQLSEDLAEEGRANILMPADVADHLDQVITAESVLRSSTIGVHSLAQVREEHRRHLPKLLLAAAAFVLVVGAGIAVMASNADHSNESAGINPTPVTTRPVELSSGALAADMQRLMERAGGPSLQGSSDEQRCAMNFAAFLPNRTVRLVLPAIVDDRRATVIGVQGMSGRDVRLYVVTGCAAGTSAGERVAVIYDRTVTVPTR
jgi:hypothetical protein